MFRELQPEDPRFIGPYRLVGQLGDGGMGRVFLGRSAGGRPVAVKVIRSNLAADPDFRVRFRREVAAARKVSGLFTAMVVDADVDAPEPWLATAYVAGPSLAEAIHDHGPLPVDSVLALAAGLAESLAAIHAAGVVHRDLKPSNVLLGRDGPCVIDFGISRAAEATSLTRAGFVIGSPGFMSPEQAEGDEVGPASDMFSLGAILAFAASGKPPFGAGATAALVYRVVHAAPRLDGVPDEIRPLVERCLAKDPRERPAAGELLTEIEAAQPMTGWLPEPITTAFPDSTAQRVAEIPVVAVEAADEPPDDPPTITGASVLVPPEHEILPPDDEAAPAEREPAAPDTEAAALEAEPAAQDAEPAAPEAEAAAPEAEPAAPEAEAAAPEADTIAPEAGLVPPEAETAPREAEAAVPALAAALGPVAAVAPLPPGPADIVPVPPGNLSGGDLPRRPRRRVTRPVVLAAAAAVILVVSIATGLGLSGPSHASASHGKATRSAVAVLAVPPSVQPSPSAAKTSPHASVSPSKRPGARTTTQAAATQAAQTTSAPASVPSSAGSTPRSSPKPSPKPTPKSSPKSTPKATKAAPLSVSVSGGSQAGCGAIGSVRSSDGASVEYTFANHSSVNVGIAMINTSGGVIGEATVAAGGVYTAGTFVGTYWEVENSGGGCLAVVGINGSGEAVVS